MGIGAALAGSAAIGSIGSIVSGILGSNAASSAASTQSNAALAEFAAIQKLMAPFVTAGTGALGKLTDLTGTGPGGNPLTAQLTKPFMPTMADLENTPGYKFSLQQGEQAVTNSFAGTGLGGGVQGIGTGNPIANVSGPEGKGLVSFAQGLAANTYQQQFSNNLTQNQQIYNMLAGIVGTGQQGAAGTASYGSQLVTGAAGAQAAGQIGSTNAIIGGITGATGGASNAALLLALQNAGMFGGGAAAGAA